VEVRLTEGLRLSRLVPKASTTVHAKTQWLTPGTVVSFEVDPPPGLS